MPQALSERPEELVRQFFADNLRPAEMQGYDPQQTDPTATDFLPVTNDWSDYGDYYPVVFVGEQNGPTLPDSGTTNINGVQGNGSGGNTYAIHNITLSVQVVEEGAYRNNTEYDVLAKEIYDECDFQLRNNPTTAVSEAIVTGPPTIPTQTRSTNETDSGSTITWFQLQGTIPVNVQYIP